VQKKGLKKKSGIPKDYNKDDNNHVINLINKGTMLSAKIKAGNHPAFTIIC